MLFLMSIEVRGVLAIYCGNAAIAARIFFVGDMRLFLEFVALQRYLERI
jgi:hypothetical protein